MKDKTIKVYFKTYGCAINQSDSETMAGVLEESTKYNIKTTSKEADADVVIVNSCTVKAATINNVLKYVDDKAKAKAVVMAGCLSQIDQSKIKDKNIVGIKHLDKITSAVINAYEKKNKTTVAKLSHADKEFKTLRLNLPTKKKNDIIEILPISNGCKGECTYCAVRFARGDFFSYPKKDILRRINEALEKGVKEIWITSQDTGCYGLDKKTNLVNLLSDILKENEGKDYFIRLGMINPQHVTDNVKELSGLLNHKNMFKFIHIPVQSGNNRVLELMKRKYTVEEFKGQVKEFRKLVPGITIATDIICGFPTETDTEFNDTLKIIDELEIDVVNISKFGLHKLTKSAKLKQVNGKTIKDRSKKLTDVFKAVSLKQNEKLLDKIITGLIDEDKKGDGSCILRTEGYKPVILNKSKDINLGDIVKVKITKANTFHLIGNII